MDADNQLLTTAELAVKFQVSEATIQRWLKDGCPHVKPSEGVLRFVYQDVLDWGKRGGA